MVNSAIHQNQSCVKSRERSSGDLDAATPLDSVVEYIDGIKRHPAGRSQDIVDILSEGHPVYSERTTNEVLKLRAYAMAALELTGFSDRALLYVQENLESAMHPYSIAAAAIALRGMDEPDEDIFMMLVRSIFRIWESDRPVSFESFRTEWPISDFSSGVGAVFQTLAHFGPKANVVLPVLEGLAQDELALSPSDRSHLTACIGSIRAEGTSNCCGRSQRPKMAPAPNRGEVDTRPPDDVQLQDQFGNRMAWDAFFRGKPTLLAFFYTRCRNPYKCTRTILNLAEVQGEIGRRGLAGQFRIAAISYDAQFDTPATLRSYGVARNFAFDDDCRMFRVTEGYDRLSELIELEVSYNQAQVSSHRIEIFILDSTGEIVRSFVRLQSGVGEIVEGLIATT